MPTQLLLADIGNTAIKLGFAPANAASYAAAQLPSDQGASAGQKLVSFVLPGRSMGAAYTPDSLGLALTGCLAAVGLAPKDIAAIGAASVVPALTRTFDAACERFLGRAPLHVGRELTVPLANRYARPTEVGADRLVTAFAARELFPGTSGTAAHIAVDFGTALTFDCVKAGAYLGGLICPGLSSSATNLFSGTAKLPQVDLSPRAGEAGEEVAIGVSTSQSLRSGLLHGFAAMAEGLLARLKEQLSGAAGGEVVCVATGGDAALVAPLMRAEAPGFDHLAPDLLLRGLALLVSGPSR